MTRSIASLAFVSLFALVVGGCKTTQAAEQPSAPPGETWLAPEQMEKTNFGIDPVGEHDVGTTIVTAGRVTFDDLHVGHVFTPVSGRVSTIKAQLGARVKKGEVLAILESPEVGQSSSDVGKADADLIAAEHDYSRKKDLFEAHAGSKADLELAEDNWRKAKAEMQRAKQKAAMFNSGYADRVAGGFALKSPIDGEVIARNVSERVEVQGQYGGGTAVELFTIGELDPVWVVAEVFEMDLPRVVPGSKVSVRVVAYPDKTFEGKVDWVSGALDPNSRTAKVRCTFPNHEKMLKPEMYATASIAVSGKKTLSIKRQALLHMGDTPVVFVQTGNAPNGHVKFERRPVVVDEDEDGDYLPVTSGLKPGDKVVTQNAILLTGS